MTNERAPQQLGTRAHHCVDIADDRWEPPLGDEDWKSPDEAEG